MNPELKAKWKHSDPHPNDRGLLLSNHIHELCQEGLIIASGYERKHLRPASYTLTIGDDYVDSDGRRRHLTREKDSFVFSHNSIVYVSAAEELDLPYYIVARFNLRVRWVYDGILLGTGPQVDPGFRGRLSCPLYNLTNLDITIKRGQEFATIDFEKTTTFLGDFSPAQREEKLKNRETKNSVEIDNKPFLLFSDKPLEALEHHPNHVLISSLVEMKNEVRTWRNIGLGLIISFIALTLSLLGFGNNIYRQVVDNLKQLEENQARIELLEQRVSQLSNAPTSGGTSGTDVGKNSNEPKQGPTEKHLP